MLFNGKRVGNIIFEKIKNRIIKDNKKKPPIVAQMGSDKHEHPYKKLSDYSQFLQADVHIYKELRQAVPIIDAAINKIIRLMGTFKAVTGEEHVDEKLKLFLENVKTSGVGTGIYGFLYSYMDSLISYGNAVGEIVTCNDCSEIYGLFNAPLESVKIMDKLGGMEGEIFIKNGFEYTRAVNPDLIIFSAMNPRAGELYGRSILEGLPFMSDILMKIFSSIGQNFERMGNVRFAVTYNPKNQSSDSMFVKSRAEMIAKEWSKAMNSRTPKDFVAIGDVDIKVIGADNNMISTEVPVRQVLEQIVAKLGIPPFLLGLHWSSTERMSQQQADILMGELVSYQNLLNPVIKKICETHLRLSGYTNNVDIVWDTLSLLDKVELANARYLNAKAEKIEMEVINEGKLHGIN